MHYIYSFGDFVGNRKNLIYIILGAWAILIINLFLSKNIKENFRSLSDLLYITNIIFSIFFLILSLQIFLNNI
jgi:hypothetical protein